MPKKMPLRGQLFHKDSMTVDGSNAAFFEDLMSDVTEEDQQEIREAHAKEMEKSGYYSAETIARMRHPQPFPARKSEDESAT